MDRRRLFIGIGIVVIALAIITGVVLFLRSRNLPDMGLLPSQGTKSGSSGSTGVSPKLEPYTKLEDTPKVPAYVPGNGPPPPIEENLRDPRLGGEAQ